MMAAATTSIETLANPSQPAAPALRLGRRAVKATIWTLTSKCGGQVIRLFSNLVLTRLLFPEAFGLMAVVLLVIHGLNLFSDVGIEQSLIQSPRGEERRFIDTAWTMQVVRGVMLWLCACVFALGLDGARQAGWVRGQSVFADPQLVYLLPVAGLTCIAAGFNSTKLMCLKRHLMLGYEAAFMLAFRVLHVVVMIAWALIHPSVWALVGGTLVGAAISAAASHYVLPGPRNRFAWDRGSARELIRFGRWIFISTILMFIATHADRAVLGSILSAELFGVYAIALVLSTAVTTVMRKLQQNVLLPLYSQLSRRDGRSELSRSVTRARLWLLGLTLPPVWLLAIFGQNVVALLYDARYHEAGWMLQVLCVGSIGAVLCITLQPIILAHGHSRRHLALTACHSVLMLTCMAVGGWAGGVAGVLIGMAAAEFLRYAVLTQFIRRYGVWTPALDAGALLVSAAVIAAGWTLVGVHP